MNIKNLVWAKLDPLKSTELYMLISFAMSNFTNREKKQLLKLCILQSLSNVLDILGILSVGYLGVLSMNAINGKEIENSFSFLDNRYPFGALDYSTKIAIVGSGIMCLLVLKTLISLYVTRKIFLFLQLKSKNMTRTFYLEIFTGSYSRLKKLINEDLHYVMSEGVPSVTFGIVAPSISVISDLNLFVLIAGVLFYVSPGSTLILIIFIVFMYFLMQKRFNADSDKLSKEANVFRMEAKRKIDSILSSFREQYVNNSLKDSVSDAVEARLKLLNHFSQMEFLPVLNRYLFEIAISVFATFIGIAEFIRTDATGAITTLLMFILAASRIAPSILRLQQNMIRMRLSKIPAKVFENCQNYVRQFSPEIGQEELVVGEFNPEIKLNKVSFSFSDSNEELFRDLNLTIASGTINCITGDSGVGKSTLVDLILGLSNPTSGDITISGTSPSNAIRTWPSQISYVPQKTVIFYDTIRGYLNFGLSTNCYSDIEIMEVLKVANIWQKVVGLPNSLDSEIGFNGDGFSGGEFQRLAIARALLWKPRLLVLDESTNALDEELENEILYSIRMLKTSSTVIIISNNKTLKTL